MCVCVSDRHIRHRACALKDTIRAIIRDELDEDFERVCEEIKESRRRRGESSRTFSEFENVIQRQITATEGDES